MTSDPSRDLNVRAFPIVRDSSGAWPQRFVRLAPEQLSELSDSDLQQYIPQCSARALEANDRYEATGSVVERAERDLMSAALQDALRERAKRPHLVAALEQQKGLS